MPLELENGFTIASGTNQQVWTDIYIPKTAAAGVYAGTLTVTESGRTPIDVPISLTVHPETMSDTASAVPAWTFIEQNYIDWFHRGEAFKFADDATSDALVDHYYRVLHRHRVDAQGGGDDQDPDNNRAARKARQIGTTFSAANGYDGPGIDTSPGVHAVGVYGNWWDEWCIDAGGACAAITDVTAPKITYWADDDKGGTNSWLT